MAEVRRGLGSRVTFVAVPLLKGASAKGSASTLAALQRHKLAPKALVDLAARVVTEKAFIGKGAEAMPVFNPRREKVGALMLWGLGPKEKLTCETLWRGAGALSRRAKRANAIAVAIPVGVGILADAVERWGGRAVGEALASGWEYGSYAYDVYKSSAKSSRRGGAPAKPVRLTLVTAGLSAAAERAVRNGVQRGGAIGEAVNFTRDLANAPANDLYPEALARHARSLARGSGLKVQVLGPADLRRHKMGALLGVAQGSARPPRLVVIRYTPKKKARKRLVLVGKAITFDSGGYSLKPPKSMEDMKFDMSGGAAVLGAMRAIAKIRPSIEVVGVVPSSENLVNGSAMRPGDVLRSASGTTIEVLNTDAEGRLILADALHYSKRFKPDYIVDFATLTGAVIVALGAHVTGLMSNNDEFAATVFDAGEACGERVWQLPLYDEFIEATRGQVADIRNSCGRNAGAITAAGFLSHFVGSSPWCHLDIAGTAWSERERPHSVAGATGVGVRLVMSLLDALG